MDQIAKLWVRMSIRIAKRAKWLHCPRFWVQIHPHNFRRANLCGDSETISNAIRERFGSWSRSSPWTYTALIIGSLSNSFQRRRLFWPLPHCPTSEQSYELSTNPNHEPIWPKILRVSGAQALWTLAFRF